MLADYKFIIQKLKLPGLFDECFLHVSGNFLVVLLFVAVLDRLE